MTPEEKLAMARECAEAVCDEDKCSPLVATGFASGQFDDHWAIRCALLAIERMQERVRAETEKVIYKVLRDYRLTNIGQEDEPSEGYPLVDAVSTPGTDISTGEEQLGEIAYAIAAAIRETPHDK